MKYFINFVETKIMTQEDLDNNNIKLSLKDFENIKKEYGVVTTINGEYFGFCTLYNLSKYCPIKWVTYTYKDSSNIRVLKLFGFPIYSITNFIIPLIEDSE